MRGVRAHDHGLQDVRPPLRRPWTEQDTRWLLRLYRHGMHLRAMAAAMDRPASTVAAALIDLGDAGLLGPEEYGRERRPSNADEPPRAGGAAV
jgi:hypothetical protein